MNQDDPDPFSHPLGGPSVDPWVLAVMAVFVLIVVGVLFYSAHHLA